MRFIANENFPLAAVGILRQAGHDVLSVSEHSPGISDSEVLRLAAAEGRVLVTFDGDYGELVYLREVPCPPAIVYLRFQPVTPVEPAEAVLNFCQRHGAKLSGCFCVIERSLTRIRPLP